MKNQTGFAHWVVVILISVMAIGLVGVAWWYEENKEKTATSTGTTTKINTNNAINSNTNTNTIAANANTSNKNVTVNANIDTNIEVDTSDLHFNNVIVVESPSGWTNPFVVHILDTNKIEQPAVTINTKLSKHDASSFKLVGNKIYFYNKKDCLVSWMGFDGKIQSLDFTKGASYLYSEGFIISPDEQQIIWTETTSTSGKLSSKLYIANINGKDKKVLFEKNFESEKYLYPVKWSLKNNELYFSEQRGGLGGYIIFGGYQTLYKVNIDTSEVTELFGGGEGWPYVTDITPDETLIIYFQKGETPQLVIKNLTTNNETIINIPLEEGFQGGGNGYFSPDNKRIAYNIAHWNSDDEHYRTIIVDVNGENQKIIADHPDKYYTVERWLSNNAILQSESGSTQIIDSDGNILKEF